ncbi:MAG: hypothetical protein RLY71_665 [Pseudomonadota bacterium]
MSISNLSPFEIMDKQTRLLNLVPATGTISNKLLRQKLGTTWSEAMYWAIRNMLIEQGKLEKGTGKGGSVRKVTGTTSADTEILRAASATTNSTPTEAPQSAPDYAKENNLYHPIATVLRNQWSKDQGYDDSLFEITAQQGSRPTGKWTRPDITAVGYKTFPYLPGRHLDVITFEIKTFLNTDITAAYEALAHRRAATKSYIVAHLPSEKREPSSEILLAIQEESRRLGLGLILIDGDPSDYEAWEQILEATRIEPDPSKLNEFIAQQTTNELKEQIIRWFK